MRCGVLWRCCVRAFASLALHALCRGPWACWAGRMHTCTCAVRCRVGRASMAQGRAGEDAGRLGRERGVCRAVPHRAATLTCMRTGQGRGVG